MSCINTIHQTGRDTTDTRDTMNTRDTRNSRIVTRNQPETLKTPGVLETPHRDIVDNEDDRNLVDTIATGNAADINYRNITRDTNQRH